MSVFKRCKFEKDIPDNVVVPLIFLLLSQSDVFGHLQELDLFDDVAEKFLLLVVVAFEKFEVTAGVQKRVLVL